MNLGQTVITAAFHSSLPVCKFYFREMTELHGIIFYSNNNGITIHVMYDIPR